MRLMNAIQLFPVQPKNFFPVFFILLRPPMGRLACHPFRNDGAFSSMTLGSELHLLVFQYWFWFLFCVVLALLGPDFWALCFLCFSFFAIV